MTHTVTAMLGPTPYRVTLSQGTHRWLADLKLPETANEGPDPHELLLSALGACTAMTIGLYAKRKGWGIDETHVVLDITSEGGMPHTTRIDRQIELLGTLDQEQRLRLLDVANACPIHRVLSGQIEIDTRLMEEVADDV
jgi:putative redox protein